MTSNNSFGGLIRNSAGNEQLENSKPRIHVDSSPLTEDEKADFQQLLENDFFVTNDVTNEKEINYEDPDYIERGIIKTKGEKDSSDNPHDETMSRDDAERAELKQIYDNDFGAINEKVFNYEHPDYIEKGINVIDWGTAWADDPHAEILSKGDVVSRYSRCSRCEDDTGHSLADIKTPFVSLQLPYSEDKATKKYYEVMKPLPVTQSAIREQKKWNTASFTPAQQYVPAQSVNELVEQGYLREVSKEEAFNLCPSGVTSICHKRASRSIQDDINSNLADFENELANDRHDKSTGLEYDGEKISFRRGAEGSAKIGNDDYNFKGKLGYSSKTDTDGSQETTNSWGLSSKAGKLEGGYEQKRTKSTSKGTDSFGAEKETEKESTEHKISGGYEVADGVKVKGGLDVKNTEENSVSPNETVKKKTHEINPSMQIEVDSEKVGPEAAAAATAFNLGSSLVSKGVSEGLKSKEEATTRVVPQNAGAEQTAAQNSIDQQQNEAAEQAATAQVEELPQVEETTQVEQTTQVEETTQVEQAAQVEETTQVEQTTQVEDSAQSEDPYAEYDYYNGYY